MVDIPAIRIASPPPLTNVERRPTRAPCTDLAAVAARKEAGDLIAGMAIAARIVVAESGRASVLRSSRRMCIYSTDWGKALASDSNSQGSTYSNSRRTALALDSKAGKGISSAA